MIAGSSGRKMAVTARDHGIGPGGGEEVGFRRLVGLGGWLGL
jgi:hypothetical protein